VLERLTESQQAKLNEALEMGSIRRAYEVLVESGSTSDFPLLLGDSMNKVLQKAYTQVPDQWRQLVNIATMPDFKEKEILRVSEADDLLEVQEEGEYKDSTLDESQEKYKLSIFGRTFSVGYRTIINDDLDAMKKQPDRFGKSASRLLNMLVFKDVLEANPNMSDSKALFHADHKNLGSDALAEGSLTVAITAMKNQTDEKGNKIVVQPKYLLVPNELEWTARKLLQSAQVPGTANNDDNVLRDVGLVPVICPWLTDTKDWYLIADPAMIDTIEVGFLRGVGEAPQLFLKSPGWTTITGMQVSPFDMDDEPIKYKVRHIAQAKAVDWRGMYKAAVA
jgi:hypothetical protein